MSNKKERIKTKIKMILASFSELKWDDIDLSKQIEDRYVSTGEMEYLVDEILDVYPNVRSTKLYNGMFSEIKKGEDIVEFILKYY